MRHRQKIWPKILLISVLWLSFFWFIFSTSPAQIYVLRVNSCTLRIPTAKIAFFTSLSLLLTLTLSLTLRSTKKGFILSLFITTFLFLRMLQVANWLTLLLLFTLTAIMLLA